MIKIHSFTICDNNVILILYYVYVEACSAHEILVGIEDAFDAFKALANNDGTLAKLLIKIGD